MWSVILKILSILGIILLCLLAFVLLTVLLVLFCPVVYRGGGTARPGEYQAWFRFRWLFGLVRGTFTYPEDGRLRVKALWLTVYDSGGKHKAEESSEEPQPEEKSRGEQKPQESQPVKKDQEEQKPQESQPVEKDQEEQKPQESRPEEKFPEKQSSADGEQTPQSQKISDLKEKLQFYLGIVRDEDNQELVKHALDRLCSMIKSIRPRYLRAEAVAGLGEPDLTGYAYGIYWAVKPFLGKKCRVDITPDFERRILEGEVFLRGRITAAVLLYHVCKVLLDRRLRQLLDQLKNK
ncbi:MAG: DUF2953 domain-containing protein [Lachnospiraceae bacterium]|nr:DUF2953 domain-containing protein [Lachnospiraceae bacterium]